MKRRRLSRDIMGVLGTRVAWTLMSMVAGVILARKLGPHNRGILALVLLLPSTVITVAKLGITQANVYFINRKQESMSEVASNSVSLALILGLLSVVVVWLIKGTLETSVLKEVEPWAIALALVRVPLLLMDDYLYGVLQAGGYFSVYNTRLVLGETLRMILVVGALVVLGMGLKAAVIIYTVVTTVNVTWLMIRTYRLVPFRLSLHPKLLGQQLVFGMKSYVQTLTAHLLLRIDVYMVAAFLNPAETAFYSLALRFTEMVLEVPQAVGLVLYPRLAALPVEEVHRLTAQACRRTLLLTGIGAFGIGVVGPFVITLWYGQAYAPAGAPLPWAAVGVLAMSIYVILSRAFTSQNRQQVNISAGIIALTSNVLLNLYLIPRIGIVGAAMATAFSYTAACVLLMTFFLMASKMSLSEVLIANGDDFRFFAQVIRRMANRGRNMVGLGSATAGR